jgi:HlyD family secretion protein
VVVVRDADPGTTIVAGQAVVEVIDPEEPVDQRALRPDQRGGAGRGTAGADRAAFARWPSVEGHVLRVEPKADAVTEETLAKATFDDLPDPMPPLGELAEVTVDLPALPAAPVIPNAAVRREGDKVGVWQIVDGDLRFSPVARCVRSRWLTCRCAKGSTYGDQIVTYSEKALTGAAASRWSIESPESSR